MTEHRHGELLGPYVLGELAARERRELGRHLEECPRCRDELDQIRQAHDLLQREAAIAPPPELEARVLAQATAQARPAHPRRRFWIPAAAAAFLVAVLGVGLLWTLLGDSSDGVPLTATALAPEASGVVRGEPVEENIRIELEVSGLPDLGEDEYYEMWYARENGGRISCGAFRPDPEGPTTVSFTTPVNAGEYPEIEVTREPDDGNPASSGEKVLEGISGTPDTETRTNAPASEDPRAEATPPPSLLLRSSTPPRNPAERLSLPPVSA